MSAGLAGRSPELRSLYAAAQPYKVLAGRRRISTTIAGRFRRFGLLLMLSRPALAARCARKTKHFRLHPRGKTARGAGQ